MARMAPTMGNNNGDIKGYLNATYDDPAVEALRTKGDEQLLGIQLGGVGIGDTTPNRPRVSPSTETRDPALYQSMIRSNAAKDRLNEILDSMEPGEVKEIPVPKGFRLHLRKVDNEPKPATKAAKEDLPF